MKNMSFDTISVIGLGYIGLPTAALLASRGRHVIGVDINPHVAATINAGEVHIVEPDLDIIVQSVVKTGHLRAVTIPEAAQAFLITVPTPFKENHEPDLTNVEAAIRAIAPVLEKGNVVILESTSPVGTTEKMVHLLAECRPDLVFPHQHSTQADISIAYCPERVMPGQIMRELIENDRIVGGLTPLCAQHAKSLYCTFVTGECIVTDARTAEMTKLTENAYRDVNIAFANELSMICDRLNINPWELIRLANHHPRVNILQPGPGVGGHCLAVDPWFIVAAAQDEAQLIRTARQVNDYKPYFILEKILAAAKKYEHPRIACLGLAYKANTDDLRESPAITIIQNLLKNTHYQLDVVEPNIKQLPQSLNHYVNCHLSSLPEAIARADVVVLMVAHNEFKQLSELTLNKKTLIAATTITQPIPVTELTEQPEYAEMMMARIYGNTVS